jgi:hypothetical protein
MSSTVGIDFGTDAGSRLDPSDERLIGSIVGADVDVPQLLVGQVGQFRPVRLAQEFEQSEHHVAGRAGEDGSWSALSRQI